MIIGSIIIMTHRIFASDGKVSVGRGGVVDRNGASLNFVTPLSDMVMIMTHDHDYHYNCNYGNYGILYYYHVINWLIGTGPHPILSHPLLTGFSWLSFSFFIMMMILTIQQSISRLQWTSRYEFWGQGCKLLLSRSIRWWPTLPCPWELVVFIMDYHWSS